MKRKLGAYLCIENEHPQVPVDSREVVPWFDLERGYRKGDVFDAEFDDTPSRKYPYIILGGIKYKQFPGQLFEVKWRISKDSLEKHFVRLRTAKLKKVRTIIDYGPDNSKTT